MTDEQVSASGPLYLEDLVVGRRFRSGERRLDQEKMIAFAEEFDPQPFHTDPEAARSSFFGGLAGSGWLTAATTMRLLVESVPVAGGVVGAGGEISWPRPTRPGDVLHVETEVLEIKPSRSRPDRAMVTTRTETLNQDNEVVQVLTSKLVAIRRDGGAD